MMDADHLAAARRALGGRLAVLRKAAGFTQAELAPLVMYGRSTIANVERGLQRAPAEFWARVDQALDGRGELVTEHARIEAWRRNSLRVAGPMPADRWADDLPQDPDQTRMVESPGGGSPVRRRDVFKLTGSAAVHGAARSPSWARLAAALTPYATPSALNGDADLATLTTAVGTVKRQYQACRYADVLSILPNLLSTLRAARDQFAGEELARVHVLSADAFHTAGSVLLKAGDVGLAVLAADRSMACAENSGDALAVGTSARIVTHALMRAGHPQRATDTAVAVAKRVTEEAGSFPEAQSVLGALLLRGAISAAQQDHHGVALDLLDEAHHTAHRIGHDGNERWTFFGPTNVLLHRVNVAVTFGDAGRAIEQARRIAPQRIALSERRACLFIDVATAFCQWGRFDRAYRALRAAEDTGPQELRTRPAARQLVTHVCQNAPPSLRHSARQLAERVGAPL